jgi:hypothetical protein
VSVLVVCNLLSQPFSSIALFHRWADDGRPKRRAMYDLVHRFSISSLYRVGVLCVFNLLHHHPPASLSTMRSSVYIVTLVVSMSTLSFAMNNPNHLNGKIIEAQPWLDFPEAAPKEYLSVSSSTSHRPQSPPRLHQPAPQTPGSPSEVTSVYKPYHETSPFHSYGHQPTVDAHFHSDPYQPAIVAHLDNHQPQPAIHSPIQSHQHQPAADAYLHSYQHHPSTNSPLHPSSPPHQSVQQAVAALAAHLELSEPSDGNALNEQKTTDHDGLTLFDPAELAQKLNPEETMLALEYMRKNPEGSFDRMKRYRLRHELKKQGFPLIARPASGGYLSEIGKKIAQLAYEKRGSSAGGNEMVRLDPARNYDNGIFLTKELPNELTRKQMELVETTVKEYPPNLVTPLHRSYYRSRLRKAGLPIEHRIIDRIRKEATKRRVQDSIRERRKVLRESTPYESSSKDEQMQTPTPVSPSSPPSPPRRRRKPESSVNRPKVPPGMNREAYVRLYVSPEDKAKLNEDQRRALEYLHHRYPLDQALPPSKSYKRKAFNREHILLRQMGVPLPDPVRGAVPLPHDEIKKRKRQR